MEDLNQALPTAGIQSCCCCLGIHGSSVSCADPVEMEWDHCPESLWMTENFIQRALKPICLEANGAFDKGLCKKKIF